MKNMKKITQLLTNHKETRNFALSQVPKETTEGRKYAVLIVFGLLSSIVIQNALGLEPLVGAFLVTCLLLFILYRDILRYKPQYLKENGMMILLGIMIIGTLLTGRVSYYMLVNLSKGIGFLSPEGAVFGMPIPAGAMLVALLFDFHTAIIFSFIVSLLSGLWLHDAIFPIYIYVGSLIAAFSVIRCKKRSALLRGGLYVGVANTLTAVMLLLFNSELFTAKAASAIIFAISSGVSVTATVSLLLPVLEYIFNVTTDISLLELLDFNQPLMKNLMVSAPGTYHHSVIVGNLVESAAEAIGVNPLLARVSAYYHDIGKIKMPEYFIENLGCAVSKHDKLTPHLSSIIITSHVKEGVELAHQHKLPQPVINIIQQHHGTATISYFFQKAREQYDVQKTTSSKISPEFAGRADTGYQPTETDYKYSGPKPQSRVAALVMMADAVEAASKMLTDPTPARISALVDKIINHIFLEGQLDECDLTLKDISEIKKHFSYILTGILHKRIEYPDFDFGSQPKKTFTETYESRHKEPPAEDKDKARAAKSPVPTASQGLQTSGS